MDTRLRLEFWRWKKRQHYRYGCP